MLYFVGYFLVLPAGTGVCAEVERDKLPEAPPATAEKCSIAEMGGGHPSRKKYIKYPMAMTVWSVLGPSCGHSGPERGFEFLRSFVSVGAPRTESSFDGRPPGIPESEAGKHVPGIGGHLRSQAAGWEHCHQGAGEMPRDSRHGWRGPCLPPCVWLKAHQAKRV